MILVFTFNLKYWFEFSPLILSNLTTHSFPHVFNIIKLINLFYLFCFQTLLDPLFGKRIFHLFTSVLLILFRAGSIDTQILSLSAICSITKHSILQQTLSIYCFFVVQFLFPFNLCLTFLWWWYLRFLVFALRIHSTAFSHHTILSFCNFYST